ncbi:MAG: signal peptidase I [Candidatus Methanoperedens sp.]|nr:signal peptidase I [Candidatus Methanoperedens sp.]
MKEVTYTLPLLVSGIFAILLLIFYLYKSENSIVMRYISSWYMKNRYQRAEIQRDTRKEDTILLIVLIILILGFGLKFILFTAVISDSMKPEFERGDLVFSQGLFKEPKIGDIITFKAAEVQNTVTHRVIGFQNNFVSTQGDNNPLPDDYGTTKEDIVAKAVIIDGHPVVLPGMGAFFILDFSKEGKLRKFGDQFEFMQKLFATIRTWGYVITIIAFSALIMSMLGNKR